MNQQSRRAFLQKSALAVAGAVTMLPQVSSASTQGIEIATLPYEINSPGRYYLNKSFLFSSLNATAIMIRSNDVTLDFNGYTIKTLDGWKNDSVGVGINGGKRVTIKNGTLRNFYAGIYNYACGEISGGHLVERMRILTPQSIGIALRGTQCVIRENSIVDIGTNTQGKNSVGISIWGTTELDTRCGGHILDNDLMGRCLFGPYYAHAGLICHGSFTAIGNRFSNLTFGAYSLSTDARWQSNLTSNVGGMYINGEDLGGNS